MSRPYLILCPTGRIKKAGPGRRRGLGAKQIELLRAMASGGFLIIKNDLAMSLAKRGLLRARGDDKESFFEITPAGFRTLAELADIGFFETDWESVQSRKRETGDE